MRSSEADSVFADRSRYQEIADALARHGMGYLLGALGLERLVPFHRGLLGHERRDAPYTRPEHVRLALEELGPTFIKLGQILSTRPDLLPPDHQAELAKLQDAAPPVDAAAVRAVLERELGADPAEHFASFDPTPLAAASIGQAHAATLMDGTEVVVKVRRPGVVEQVERDLEVLHNLTVRASRRWEPAAAYDVVGLAEEFAATLRAELDYLQEARNAERFAANFADVAGVHIPRVFWETTTSRVLTLERVRGINVADVDALDAAGIDRHELAASATRVTAQMVFEDGFFHADPHPGNLFIEPGGRIGLIDFGMVGELDERLREQLSALLVALARDDAARVADAVLDLGVARGAVDRRALRDDLAALVRRYGGSTIAELDLARMIEEILAIVRLHELQLPRELALLFKMLVMNDGMARRLAPEFRFADVLAPYAERFVARQLSPAAVARRFGRSGFDAVQLGIELPAQLRRVLADLERGGLETHLRADELEPLVARAERAGNRLVAGMIAAALIDAVAGIMTVDPERWRARESQLLALGAGAAGSLGGYLAWTAWRTARRRPRLRAVGPRTY